MSAFFEEKIRTIISEYKTANKSSDRLRRSQRFRKKMQQQDPSNASSRSVLSYASFFFRTIAYNILIGNVSGAVGAVRDV